MWSRAGLPFLALVHSFHLRTSRQGKGRGGSWGSAFPSSNPRVYSTETPLLEMYFSPSIFRVIITRPLSRVGEVPVLQSPAHPLAICRRATAKGYEDFYFPVMENRLRCVTK